MSLAGCPSRICKAAACGCHEIVIDFCGYVVGVYIECKIAVGRASIEYVSCGVFNIYAIIIIRQIKTVEGVCIRICKENTGIGILRKQSRKPVLA